MDNYLEYGANQEKFALAWINGYKIEEKKFLVKFKNLGNVYGYLNYEREAKIFKLSSKDIQYTSKQYLQKHSLKKMVLVGCLIVKEYRLLR